MRDYTILVRHLDSGRWAVVARDAEGRTIASERGDDLLQCQIKLAKQIIADDKLAQWLDAHEHLTHRGMYA